MEVSKAILLAGSVLVIVLFFYVVLPKLNLKHQSNIIFKGLLFFGMMGYLAYDFYMKEKYWYILVLAVGSVAFLMLLFARKSEE
jgi:hypothetical protein